MSETENNIEEAQDTADKALLQALEELDEVVSLIQTGQMELRSSDYDCNQTKQIHGEIAYRTNVGYQDEAETLQKTAEDLVTLKAELRKALPYLIDYAGDPRSGNVGPTYKFRLMSSIDRVKNFLVEA